MDTLIDINFKYAELKVLIPAFFKEEEEATNINAEVDKSIENINYILKIRFDDNLKEFIENFIEKNKHNLNQLNDLTVQKDDKQSTIKKNIIEKLEELITLFDNINIDTIIEKKISFSDNIEEDEYDDDEIEENIQEINEERLEELNQKNPNIAK